MSFVPTGLIHNLSQKPKTLASFSGHLNDKFIYIIANLFNEREELALGKIALNLLGKGKSCEIVRIQDGEIPYCCGAFDQKLLSIAEGIIGQGGLKMSRTCPDQNLYHLVSA